MCLWLFIRKFRRRWLYRITLFTAKTRGKIIKLTVIAYPVAKCSLSNSRFWAFTTMCSASEIMKSAMGTDPITRSECKSFGIVLLPICFPGVVPTTHVLYLDRLFSKERKEKISMSKDTTPWLAIHCVGLIWRACVSIRNDLARQYNMTFAVRKDYEK